MSEENTIHRFLNKIEFTDTCWLWTGATTKGYGQLGFKIKGELKIFQAHRLAYRFWVGPIPCGLPLDHDKAVCKNRNCVKPEHLEPVTTAENNRRVYGQRPGYCAKDLHDLTLPGAREGIQCRVCKNIQRRSRRRKH